MNDRLQALVLTSLLLLAPPMALPADEKVEEPDDGMRNCISVSRIRNTEVVDDLNVLFYMRGSRIYHNILPRRCPGLAREKRFSYRVSGSSLCHMDSIQVLYSYPGGFNDGPTCSLGYFQEITKEDAEGILEGTDDEPQPNPLPPAEPEDMTPEADEES
ncbi:MAG: hypothetical protein R3192_05730 [Woeseiaceae bacterium]|nr:hypothetical protein [Woeseiaceae bacterium]